jgi:hypothetical protein
MRVAMAWSAEPSVKELTTMLAPSAASASAMASPMPELEPVTMAVFPESMAATPSRAAAARLHPYIAVQQNCQCRENRHAAGRSGRRLL